uniref:Glutaredoxin domain-containing protein n=1 Tax=Neobodo designis TaxID=312471 RepID=A0A7S1LNE3_NEODS|mmetsp:Transcript_25120/g.77617  ORF Transcript_25120/g.77617 Transcript_25120/m.77617 type:complete len:158 (+) Transcript_25120:33-506(+)
MLRNVLRENWALILGHSRGGAQQAHLKQYVSWYTVKCRLLLVDQLVAGDELRAEAFDIARANGCDEVLPLLFVDQKLVGDLEAVRALDMEAKLKDVLHFGFKWPDLHTNDSRAGPMGRVGTLRPSSSDDDVFHGRYRGAPTQGAVMALPKFSPGSLD